MLRADSDRLQPSNQRDVVLVHYSASRMHTIALLLCIRGYPDTDIPCNAIGCILHLLVSSSRFPRSYSPNSLAVPYK